MPQPNTPEIDAVTPDHAEEARRLKREADELSRSDAAIRQPADEDDDGVGGVSGLVP